MPKMAHFAVLQATKGYFSLIGAFLTIRAGDGMVEAFRLVFGH